MAESCGLGVTQFVHHVKLLTNMTPLQYLNSCRLEMAARLLRERSTDSIVDVAMACGFSSSQYFATVFSQRFGGSPRDFRRRITA
jgi:AraC family L-rhamnose operon regulatory protein RhaS